MKSLMVISAALLVLSACTQKSAYETAVEDLEPRYCYKSIGGISCYAKPYHRDERRLVNYYGPAPVRYDRPEAESAPNRSAPEPVGFWVKDPEPVPSIAIRGDIADRPWLQNTGGVEKYEASPEGLEAFLSNIRQNARAEPVSSRSKLQAQTF
jgi:hypothetical protein